MPDPSALTDSGWLRTHEPARATRAQWSGLWILIAVCLGFWLFHTGRYHAPNSDFVSYRDASVALYHGQLPAEMKRPPAWPLVMGLPSQALPGDRPYLWGATGANLVLGALALVLLFKLACCLVPRAPLLPVMVFALFPAYHVWVTQPLAEPTMLVAVLAALLALARRSGWAYVFAAIASVTRIEFVALIPVFALIDLADRPTGWWLTFAYSAGAVVPIAGWTLLGSLTRAEAATVYAAETQGFSLANRLEKVVWMLRPLPDARLGSDLLLAIGSVVGGVVLVLKRSRLGWGVAGFLAVYLAAHAVYPAMRARYMVPSSWAVLLLAVVGYCWLVPLLFAVWTRATRGRSWLPAVLAVAAVLLALAVSAWAVRSFRSFDGTPWAGPWFYLAVWLTGACAASCYAGSRVQGSPMRWQRTIIGAGVLTALVLPTVFAARGAAAQYHKLWLDKAEYRAMADWLDAELPADAQAVTPFRDLIAFMVAPDIADRLIDLQSFPPGDADRFVRACESQQIEYVVYIYWPKPDAEDPGTEYELDQLKYARARFELLEPFVEHDRVGRYQLVAEIQPPEGSAAPPGRVFRLQDPR